MLEISKYIYDFLNDGNPSVIVPDLGCFTVVDKPSVIQNNIVIPPVRTVELDSENSDDDHVFTRYIAEKENISVEQAVQEVDKFYDHFFMQKLAKIRRPITFENFGTFSLNDSGDIQFEPVVDFIKDNYGLGQAYISSDVTIPPPFEVAPVMPEPEPVAPPPAPEPFIPVEPEPVQPPPPPEPVQPLPPPEPVQPPSEPVQPIRETEAPSPKPDGSLFETSNNTRYRENKERRRPAAEAPLVQPTKSHESSKQSKPPKPPKPSKPLKPIREPKPPKQPKAKKTGSSNSWVLWVLLIAATLGLGVAGYFYYPEFNKFLTKGRPVTFIAETSAEAEAEPEIAEATEENIPNAEVAQSLDEATDKRNALNPESNQQTPTEASRTPSTPSTPSTSSTSSTTSTSSTPSTPSTPVPQTQGNAGSGQWVLVAGSFKVQSNAINFEKTLQAEGYSCEIILAKNQLYWVTIGSFDTMAEAQRQANQTTAKHEVWIAKR